MTSTAFPEATRYRQTFLRRHVPVERDRTVEVLAVDDVIRRLEDLGCTVPVEERRRLLDDFFRIDEPGAEDRLYFALALKPLDQGPGVRGWPSLTEALRAPVAGGTPSRILLAART